MSSYPKWKYSKDGTAVVNSAEEEAALKGVWKDSPADVKELADKADPITGQVAHVDTVIAPTESASLPAPIGPGAVERDRLLYQAEGLGLKVDKRSSNETIRRQIFESASA